MADNKQNIDVDFWLLALVIAVIAFHGNPDLIQAIIFKLTGVKEWTP